MLFVSGGNEPWECRKSIEKLAASAATFLPTVTSVGSGIKVQFGAVGEVKTPVSTQLLLRKFHKPLGRRRHRFRGNKSIE